MDKEKINNERELLIKSLILNNMLKPLKFHIDNLKANNINLTKSQVKWNTQKILEQI